jgi:long-chain fatty acid transport protein
MEFTSWGTGTLVRPPPTTAAYHHTPQWPLALCLAAASGASDALTLAAQLDYVQWSRFESLDIHFPGFDTADQHFELDWSDTITARVGASYAAGAKLVLRGGVLYDSNAVPDRTIARQYLDGPKGGLSAGASVVLSKKVTLDLAASGVAGTVRHVPDNTDEAMGWEEVKNDAPGDHSGQVFTLSTGLRILL